MLHKWLRDRKRADYPLSFDDVQHYGKIVVALEETIQLMEAIDETIPKWPIDDFEDYKAFRFTALIEAVSR